MSFGHFSAAQSKCKTALWVSTATTTNEQKGRTGQVNSTQELGSALHETPNARFIQGTANGVHAEATQLDEWDLVSDVESTLRRAVVLRQGTQQFTTDDDLDVEVTSSPERTCIQVQNTRLCMALPADPEAAYQQLHELLQRFLSACRSTAQVA